MAYYSEELVEEVRRKNDIVEVISPHVKLTRRGVNYFGLCPFHNEKTPSFSVSAPKQMYYCFGCGAGGNVVSFVMAYENYTFQEALKVLADRAGVALPEREPTEEEKRAAGIRTQLMDVNRDAAAFYYYLLRSPAGEPGMKYLRGRGLTDETLRRFGLGFSSVSGSLYRHLKQKGYTDDVLSKSGIFRYKEGNVTDYFWNRVIFPIMDVRSRVVGFGGRVMGSGEPKYLNSPATDVFDKSRMLYGLNYARTTRRNYFLLCEGYMDVISLHQAGFDCAVASLGTSFTGGHAVLIKRYTKEVVLTYDSDGAGRKAALRAIPILRSAGISVRVLDMKPYKDPDEFIKALGAEAYEERIAHAENFFYFQSDMLREGFDLNDPDGKTQFERALAESLTQFADELERNNYVGAVAARYGIDAAVLRAEVNRAGGRMATLDGSRTATPDGPDGFGGRGTLMGPDASYESGRGGKSPKARAGIVEDESLVLSETAAGTIPGASFLKLFRPEFFDEGVLRKIAEYEIEAIRAGRTPAAAEMIGYFAEEPEKAGEAAAVFSVSLNEDEDPVRQMDTLRKAVARVRKEAAQRLINEADSGISQTELFAILADPGKYDF